MFYLDISFWDMNLLVLYLTTEHHHLGRLNQLKSLKWNQKLENQRFPKAFVMNNLIFQDIDSNQRAWVDLKRKLAL